MEYHENYSKIEQPCLIMSKKSIRKVSCGTGYTLMLDIFGWIWSMGLNNIGQLGLGHFRSDI